MTGQSRVRAGVPTGGQFAVAQKTESSVALTEPARRATAPYGDLIAQDIGTDEPEMCALVEDFMRIQHSTLDGLSRVQFRVEAREAHRDIQAWADGGAEVGEGMTLQRYCDAAGLAYPPSLDRAEAAREHDATRARSIGPKTVFDSKCHDIQTGKIADRVMVNGRVFHRRRDGVFPDWPYAMRFQANRPLTDDEARRFAGLVGYAYRATVAGEPLGDPERDSPYSFIVSADTTKTSRDDVGMALEEFEDQLPAMIRDGSPVRKTDRAGAGTKGTRLIDGFGEPDLKFEMYYDDVSGVDAP